MTSPALNSEQLSFVRDVLVKDSAIVLDDSKDYLIHARLEPIVAEAGLSSIHELVEAVRRDKLLRTRVVEALTTNETFFFRDHWPFECLKKEILPSLLTARASTKKLSIWSAACSTGQEAYSIAMLLLESFPDVAQWPVRIVATDIAEAVLSRARSGRFTQLEVNRGLPIQYLLKYFERDGADWVVSPRVRAMVTFSQMNLASEWSFAQRFDVVFLRNVLIYFDQKTRKQILERVRHSMTSDGALLMGAAESTVHVDEKWERVTVGQTGFFRVKP